MSLTTKQIIRLTEALGELDIDADEFDFDSTTLEQADKLVSQAYALPAISEDTPIHEPAVNTADMDILAASEIAAHMVAAYKFQDLKNWYKVSGDEMWERISEERAEKEFAEAQKISEITGRVGLKPSTYILGLMTHMEEAIRAGEWHWQEVGTNAYLAAQAAR